jgi:hypothetical protein
MANEAVVVIDVQNAILGIPGMKSRSRRKRLSTVS